jgi:succinate dehydrogenase/fumarate reductase flavoprotein subunit
VTRRIVVVGSGAAGTAAALAAADAGAAVTLLERGPKVGGTTALSGAVSWLPSNHLMPPEQARVDAERAAVYLQSLGLGDADAELAELFARDAARVAKQVEERSGHRWQPVPYPDYHSEFDGGIDGGRSLEPQPYAPPAEVAALVREAPNVPLPITYRELATGEIDRAALEQRRERGEFTLGRALIAALLTAGLERGVELRVGVRAHGLIVERGAVRGVETDDGAFDGHVVLASGGFERNPSLVRTFLRGPMLAPTGVPTCEGDAVRMALAVGSELGNMSEAHWCPAISIPGETIDGAPMHRLILTERAKPGSLLVDSRGRRFADEAQNYNDLGRSLHDFEAASYSFPRVPSWLVFDGAYRRKYHFGPLRRRMPDPDWLPHAADVRTLAGLIGADQDTLAATVERFNRLAESGRDDDFGRGSYAYDRFIGDSDAPHPTLAPLTEPPFYAVRVLPGCLGTKGGPRTDEHGRVRAAASDKPIQGLYAAGNAAASPLGMAYPGAGGTIGPALVWGTRAGEAAAGD